MANPTCSSTTLITNAASYMRGAGLNPVQQKALFIYAQVLQLNAIGGTNYTSTLGTTLVSDAASLEIGESEDELTAGAIALEFSQATSAGASVPSSLSTKLSNSAVLTNLDPLILDKIILMLNCKLGVAKPYPQ